jgi:hypothetical protein
MFLFDTCPTNMCDMPGFTLTNADNPFAFANTSEAHLPPARGRKRPVEDIVDIDQPPLPAKRPRLVETNVDEEVKTLRINKRLVVYVELIARARPPKMMGEKGATVVLDKGLRRSKRLELVTRQQR